MHAVCGSGDRGLGEGVVGDGGAEAGLGRCGCCGEGGEGECRWKPVGSDQRVSVEVLRRQEVSSRPGNWRVSIDKDRCILLPYVEQWGNPWELLRCIWRNREALQRWYADPRHEISADAELFLGSPVFWVNVEGVTKLISGISERQKVAEIGKGFNIAKVQTLWLEMRRHIDSTASPELLPSILEIFEKHRMQQHSNLFIVANTLDPRTAVAFPPTPQATNILIDFVCQYSPKPSEARSQFTQFCTGTGVFTRTNRVYDLIEDPVAFWTEMMLFSKPLAELALRIFNTPATCSPSQRDFITSKPVHVGWQLNFGLQKANELYFVYVNQRLLSLGQKTSVLQPDEHALVEKEDREFGPVISGRSTASEEVAEGKKSAEIQSNSSPGNEPLVAETRELQPGMRVQDEEAVAVKDSPEVDGGFEDPEADAGELKREAMVQDGGIELRGMDADGEIENNDLDAAGVEDDIDTLGPESLAVSGMGAEGIVVGGFASNGMNAAGTDMVSPVGGEGGGGAGGVERDVKDRANPTGAGIPAGSGDDEKQRDDAVAAEDLVEDSLDSRAYAQVGLG